MLLLDQNLMKDLPHVGHLISQYTTHLNFLAYSLVFVISSCAEKNLMIQNAFLLMRYCCISAMRFFTSGTFLFFSFILSSVMNHNEINR